MHLAPANVRGDEHCVSIYLALMARSEQVKVRNRGETQLHGAKKTTCIVITGLLQPITKWGDEEQVARLKDTMTRKCASMGWQLKACVTPPASRRIWAHQIFVALEDEDQSAAAQKHFGKMTIRGVRVTAEVKVDQWHAVCALLPLTNTHAIARTRTHVSVSLSLTHTHTYTAVLPAI